MKTRSLTTRLLSAVLAASIAFSALPLPALALEQEDATPEDGQTTHAVPLAGRTAGEVEAAISRYNAQASGGLTFVTQPDLSKFITAGETSQQDLENGLNALNLVRYIAGLPEVELKDEYNELAQYAAVSNAAIGSLAHAPTQPSNMPDEFYQQACKGASKSNLFWAGYSANYVDAVDSFLHDKGTASMGHRRWMLHPDMGATGFGGASCGSGTYIAMYAHDTGAPSDVEYVAWPCANTPYDLAEGMMTFSSAEPMTDPKVTAVNRSTGEQRVYQEGGTGSRYFTESSNLGYLQGHSSCLIFGDESRRDRPQFGLGETWDITVSYTDAKGPPVEVKYTINYLSKYALSSGSASSGGSGGSNSGGDDVALVAIAGIALAGGLIWLADRYMPIHTVSGRVTDSNGLPVQGATVLCYNGERTPAGSTVTGADGSFSIQLARGWYRVEAQYTTPAGVTVQLPMHVQASSTNLVFALPFSATAG